MDIRDVALLIIGTNLVSVVFMLGGIKNEIEYANQLSETKISQER